MDRLAWLKEKRRVNEAQEDTIYAPIYDEKWGTIDPTHQQFFRRFLGLCPRQGHILDAACGTGKYWPLILASGRTVFGIDQSQGMLARACAKFPGVPSEKVGLQEMHYQPVMRLGLTLSDEKKTAERYTASGSGVTEVERPWCLQPVYQPDPRTVFRHPFLLPSQW